ncbi:hypothetical protein [Halegenticoccus tardaugens]|uniref:hypothetical protein n=1 Tax=Halegenticoccus tardaugens TaxID=2071624 RepID=UPI00100C2D91|nr:hypothetical protein [Halegenticoccus tardaugens]
MSDGTNRRRDGVGGADPAAIRSIAVTVDDVVTALEATERSGRRVVLRITPPFYGRMRARIHVEGGEGAYEGDERPIHVDPRRLVDADAPPYPEVDETVDELGARMDYSPEEHRARHVEAVERWRAAVREHLVRSVALETPDGPHEVDVKPLG